MVGDTLYLNVNQHQTLKALSKCREQPTITSIRHSPHQTAPFHFSCIHKITDLKEKGTSAVERNILKSKMQSKISSLNYCMTINMQKICSIRQSILEIK